MTAGVSSERDGAADLSALRRRDGVRIYAHRGASRAALENTMPAFEAALAAGADGIELDVQLSRDGEVMVFHDATLQRLGEREDRLADLSATELDRVTLQGGARMPRLDDVLDLLAGKPAVLNVEIKGDGGHKFRLASRVSALLRRRSAADRARIWVSSFRPEVLVFLRALLAAVPERRIPDAFLFDAENTGPRRSWVLEQAGRFAVVHPQFRMVDVARMKRWSAAGKVVNAWTVDAPEELLRVASLGVDGVITNDPAGAREVLSEAGHCRAEVRGL